MQTDRDKERYARDPIATTHHLDWWHVGGARFTQRMRPRDRHEWERLTTRLTIPGKELIELPYSSAAVCAVVLSGRVRMAIPAPKPDDAEPGERRPDAPKPKEEEPKPAARSGPPQAAAPTPGPPPAPAQQPAPPRHPIVYVADAGDLIGTFGARGQQSGLVLLETEALRDTELLVASPDAFRGYMWRRSEWPMPPPAAGGTPACGARAIAFQGGARALDVMRDTVGPGPVPLADLCGRTRNSRAALALLAFLGRGHALAGPALRIRRRLWPTQLARRIGADVEWVKMWIRYAESEGVVDYARGRWTIRQQWRLHRWATQIDTEQSFELPPDPFEEPMEPEVTLGRASRNADGTTPTVEDAAAVPPY
ncbi:hypothetical protein HN371_12890 [Candidatus Poribacteria bacterium]|jgi:hypothetical protein|nr:hypothetical protein [Candidatus Poribacteria bacterium]MBT5537278.1 hypothetical protein [Candidatus Poribacteria bacterium]MBT7804582.1 hypothetical protein [Candidatus Poribacteria bacterium]